MPLNSNQRGFIALMKKDEESEDDGFVILSRREDAADYFDALVSEGLIEPSKIKGPTPAPGKEGYVNLPYWRGLDYLVALSKLASANAEPELSKKLADLILRFSREAGEEQKQNYFSWRAFAEIISNLPLTFVSDEILAEVRSWLASRFDSSMVAEMLGNKLLPRLINSDQERDLHFAVDLLDILTGLTKKRRPLGGDEEDPATEVEVYWINEILKKNLASFIAKRPLDTANLFKRRVNEVFGGNRATSSWLYRPAVEDHAQNMEWQAPENTVVEALRDTLSGWMLQDVNAAAAFLVELLGGSEIQRRVAIHIFDKHFALLRPWSDQFIGQTLINTGLIHESYNLLVAHGVEFSPAERDRVFKAIDDIVLPTPEDGEDDGRTERLKQRWLSALVTAGVPGAAERFAPLEAKYGAIGENPDFLSYHTSSSGPGPSPFSKAELLGFLLEGVLVERLEGYVESSDWRGHNKRALSDTLQEAIVENPRDFLAARKAFLASQRVYQYSFLSGFLRLWSNDKAKPVDLDWSTAWPALLDWVLVIVSDTTFWQEVVLDDHNRTPDRLWLVHQIAELVQSGTREDSHAIDAGQLPKLRRIVEALLVNLPPESFDPSRDAVNHVINSGRGKAIEGLVNFALRCCRVEDKKGEGHAALWQASLKPLFDAEIQRVPFGNQEFSVLFGQYLAQFMYLSPEWLQENILAIFRPGSVDFRLGLSGLIYASVNRPLYRLLVENGIVDHGLMLEADDNSRERLVERVAIALLWQEEQILGERFQSFFHKGRVDDLKKIASTYWTARKEQLSEKQIELVQQYWRIAVDWTIANAGEGRRLTSSLLSLLCYFKTIEVDDQPRMKWLVRHSGPDDRNWFLGEDFDRLADSVPEFIGQAMLAYLETSKPFYDHDGHLLSTTRKILSVKPEVALEISNRLRNIEAFKTLYREIRGI